MSQGEDRPVGTASHTVPLAPATRPLPPPRFTGSSAGALIHAVLGIVVAATFWAEPPGGYTVAVWSGPRSMTDWLPIDPWQAWSILIAGPSVVVLVGRGAPFTRWALALLAACWAALGCGALAVGLTSDQAASVAGWLLVGLAVSAARDALALGRRRG